MTRVTRKYRFSASHRLHARELPDARNRELYGKCNNPYGHGHDYVLEISVRGPIDPVSGRAADVRVLDCLVQERVLAAIDHKDLNTDVPAFASAVPTTENLVLEVRNRLKERWAAAFPGEWPKLERIRIQETKRNAFEINEKI